jgi:RNA polymerase sigma factor (sigma-70 family)
VARPALAKLVDTLRTAARPAADPGTADTDLLARFVADRDETAFRTLVTRHGPTVLAACRQVLSDPADIDDVFQATFLVLMKKAKAVADANRLGGWLFAVAHRTAVRCRADARRRRARETTAANRTRMVTELPDLTWREAAAVLHDELNALTDAYRLPLLLCCVQGLTRDEAAEQLGTTVGAIRGRLERGRALLERRLTRRGVVLSAGLLAGLVGTSRAAAGPTAGLIELNLRATSGPPSPAAAALARGGVPMTTLWKHTVLAAFLVLGLIGVGLSGDPQPPRSTEKGPAKVAATERVVTGKVIGADGRPVAADLSLVRNNGETVALGRSNADGTFRVSVPHDTPNASIVAAVAGHGLDFLPLGSKNDLTLTLPKERPLRGRVLDLQGKPVAGATVTASDVGAFNPDTNVERRLTGMSDEAPPFAIPPRGDRTLTGGPTATTDQDGRFQLRGLGVGHLITLRVRATGAADADFFCLNKDGFDAPAAEAACRRAMAERPGAFYLERNAPYRACGPDPTILVEPQKVIRGIVTDPAGKPRAGVRVTFSRVDWDGFIDFPKSAVTDKDGKYQIHGVRRYSGYVVECLGDAAAATLPCQGFAKDTPGFEPVVIDLKCAKGLIVTGTVRNKLTGKPVAADLDVEVLVNNPFISKFPPYMHGGSVDGYRFPTDQDGRFRIVTIPGPVLLMAMPRTDDPFKPAVPDPKHPGYFSMDGDYHMFAKYSDGAATRGILRGAWCRVLDLKPTDDGVTVDVELDPAESRRGR